MKGRHFWIYMMVQGEFRKKYLQMGNLRKLQDGGGVEVFTFSNGTYFYSQVVGGGPYPGAIDDCYQFKEGTNVIFGLEMSYKILKNEADEFLLEATLLGVEIGTIKFTNSREKNSSK